MSKHSVSLAVTAFVESAAASESAYSGESLTEMVRDAIALQESGGLVSSFKRFFTGMDSHLFEEIEEELKEIKTQKDKDEVLKAIDKYLKQANDYTGGQLTAAIVSAVTIPLIPVASVVFRTHGKMSGSTDKYVKALKALRTRVNSIKVKG